MNRKLYFATIFLVIFGLACGSINRVIPTDEAMKVDVKGKIAAVYPAQTDQIGVTVDSGVVTLSGTVDNATQRNAIADAANSVHGVKRVINNIQIK